MKIIRFVDDQGSVHHGYNYSGSKANLLSGNIINGFNDEEICLPVKKLLCPLEPTVILCIGLNYTLHANEFGAAPPKYPILFMKNPGSICHPDDAIILPESCLDPLQVDYETELVVIIGRAAKNVRAEDALGYVFGYTIGNDVSARRWQKEAGGGQWVRGKSFDTFCPLGPAMLTADEIEDPQDLSLECFLNGQQMQKGQTRNMLFSVAQLIEYLSSGTSLLPGTIIMTGTPDGVGFVRKPPVFLKPGDLVEMRIEPIGTLRNRVAAER